MSVFVYWAWTWSFREATRTIKNSSRFEDVMLRNFSRSKRGIVLSRASLNTRLLNKSQLSSRFT